MVNGEIAFRDVSFQYPSTRGKVLEGVSFKVEAGETVSILGATGSGKTSLFQLIPRLYDATEGSIGILTQRCVRNCVIRDMDVEGFDTAYVYDGSFGFVPHGLWPETRGPAYPQWCAQL